MKICGRCWLVCAFLLFSSFCAFAALGGNEASVEDDVARMQATVKTSQAAAYTLHEIKMPTGTAVREYVSAGKVFAVAWSGPYPPDIKQLLGSYDQQYEQAIQNSPRRVGHGPMTLSQGNLVVQFGGHMGAFSGRAYLSDQLPGGVSLESIR